MKKQHVLFDESSLMPTPLPQTRRAKYKLQRKVTLPVSDVHPTGNRHMEATISEDTVTAIANQVIAQQHQEATQRVEQQAVEDKISTEQRMDHIINNPSRTLFKAKGVFPFQLFPDEILIEEFRVNILTRSFFASEQLQSISYKELRKTEVETNLFFGTIRFITLTAIENHIEVSFFKRDDALKIQRIIEGLKILSEQQVDLSQIDTETLLEKVEYLGSLK
ncbi:hypothetical protein BH11PAT1_BH11PAT1_7820 [soil metagenome]